MEATMTDLRELAVRTYERVSEGTRREAEKQAAESLERQRTEFQRIVQAWLGDRAEVPAESIAVINGFTLELQVEDLLFSFDRQQWGVSLVENCPHCHLNRVPLVRYGNYYGLAEIGGALVALQQHPENYRCWHCQEEAQHEAKTSRAAGTPTCTPDERLLLDTLKRVVQLQE